MTGEDDLEDFLGILDLEPKEDFVEEVLDFGVGEDFDPSLFFEKTKAPQNAEDWRQALVRFEPNADPDILAEVLHTADEAVLDFIISRTRDREVATFKCLLRQGYITKSDCHRLGFDSVVTRDLKKEGIHFVFKKGGHYVVWKECRVGDKYLTTMPSHLRDKVLAASGGRCALCGNLASELFPDHSVPREIAGDSLLGEPGALKAYCRSCNNRKQHMCRRCPNRNGERSIDICRTCRMASPQMFTHEATVPLWGLRVTGTEAEVSPLITLARKKDLIP